jgi:hypothetical protein
MKKLNKSDIPEGYSYAAVDAYGMAYAFKYKPFIEQGHWYSLNIKDEIEILLGSDFDTTDWSISLITNNFETEYLTSEHIPPEYKYAAVNLNGKAYAFKSKPIISIFFDWRPANGSEEFQRIEGNFDWYDWKNSLVSVED